MRSLPLIDARRISGRAKTVLQTAAATAVSALLGGAVASATPPAPDIIDVYLTGTDTTVLVNITWDGSVYSSETMYFESAINATNGPTWIRPLSDTGPASYGYYNGLDTQQPYVDAKNNTVEVGAFAYDGNDFGGDPWMGTYVD